VTTTKRTEYPVIDEILDSVTPQAECTCHKFIRLHDGHCAVHGFVRQQTDNQPAPPAAGVTADKWRYVETQYAAEVLAGELTLKPHWRGLSDTETIRATMRQVAIEHNQHQQLVAALREVAMQLKTITVNDIHNSPAHVMGVINEVVESANAVLNKQEGKL
jgi:hypothetical protein